MIEMVVFKYICRTEYATISQGQVSYGMKLGWGKLYLEIENSWLSAFINSDFVRVIYRAYACHWFAPLD